jgi:hypothetical protein
MGGEEQDTLRSRILSLAGERIELIHEIGLEENRQLLVLKALKKIVDEQGEGWYSAKDILLALQAVVGVEEDIKWAEPRWITRTLRNTFGFTRAKKGGNRERYISKTQVEDLCLRFGVKMEEEEEKTEIPVEFRIRNTAIDRFNRGKFDWLEIYTQCRQEIGEVDQKLVFQQVKEVWDKLAVKPPIELEKCEFEDELKRKDGLRYCSKLKTPCGVLMRAFCPIMMGKAQKLDEFLGGENGSAG